MLSLDEMLPYAGANDEVTEWLLAQESAPNLQKDYAKEVAALLTSSYSIASQGGANGWEEGPEQARDAQQFKSRS